MSKNIKGAIPKWRFLKFKGNGDWERKKLGKMAFIVNDKIAIEKLNAETYISTENMLPNFAGVSTASQLPQTGNFTKFKAGDILVSNIRPYLKKVWRSNKTGGASNDVIVFRSNSDIDSNFLEFILKNELFINYVMKNAKGLKMPRGDKESMLIYPVYIPPYPTFSEQQKIADCLSSVDDLISAEEKKLLLLNDYKKGWMQKLFPAEGKTVPEWRFPEFKDRGEWTSDLIANVISTIRPPKKLSTFEYKMIGRYPIVDQGQDEFCGWTDERSSLVDFDNKVLIFGDHTCVVKLVDRPFAQGADGIKIISTKKKISVDFLFQYLCNSPIIPISYKRHFSELKEKTILFPDLDSGEQEKISRFLFSIDILIKKEKNKITELKQHKKALMQGLFPATEEVL